MGNSAASYPHGLIEATLSTGISLWTFLCLFVYWTIGHIPMENSTVSYPHGVIEVTLSTEIIHWTLLCPFVNRTIRYIFITLPPSIHMYRKSKKQAWVQGWPSEALKDIFVSSQQSNKHNIRVTFPFVHWILCLGIGH